jgi:hypothetical protein
MKEFIGVIIYKDTAALIYDRILKCKQIKGGIFFRSDKKIKPRIYEKIRVYKTANLLSSVFQLYLYFVNLVTFRYSLHFILKLQINKIKKQTKRTIIYKLAVIFLIVFQLYLILYRKYLTKSNKSYLLTSTRAFIINFILVSV